MSNLGNSHERTWRGAWRGATWIMNRATLQFSCKNWHFKSQGVSHGHSAPPSAPPCFIINFSYKIYNTSSMFLKLDSYHIFSLLTDSLTVIVKIYIFDRCHIQNTNFFKSFLKFQNELPGLKSDINKKYTVCKYCSLTLTNLYEGGANGGAPHGLFSRQL